MAVSLSGSYRTHTATPFASHDDSFLRVTAQVVWYSPKLPRTLTGCLIADIPRRAVCDRRLRKLTLLLIEVIGCAARLETMLIAFTVERT